MTMSVAVAIYVCGEWLACWSVRTLRATELDHSRGVKWLEREGRKHLWEKYAFLNYAHFDDIKGDTSPPTQENSTFLWLGSFPLAVFEQSGGLCGTRSFVYTGCLGLTMVPPLVFLLYDKAKAI